jgi:polyketide cyclase/dehydrase/lipid transport protein
VRYADGPTAEVEVEVDALVERVWVLVTDIELPARFSSELQSARWLDDGPTLAARFVGRSEHPAAGTWETTCVVTECEALRSFGWAVGDPDHPSARWRFALDPLAGGRTRLRQWMQMGPAPSGLTPAIEAMPDKEERIVARRLDEHRANMAATLAGIKDLAESAP